MCGEEQMERTWSHEDESELLCVLRDEENTKGVIDWNAVVSATQSKVSLSKDLITAANCKLKYREILERYKDSNFSKGCFGPIEPTLTEMNLFLISSNLERQYNEEGQLIKLKLKELRSKKDGEKHNNDDNKEEEEVILLDGIEHVVLRDDLRLQFERSTEELRKKYSRLFVLLAHHKDQMLQAVPKANNASSRATSPGPCSGSRATSQKSGEANSLQETRNRN